MRLLVALLLAAASAVAQTYSLSIYGGHTVYAGYDTYVRVLATYPGIIEGIFVETAAHVSFTGQDASMTVTPVCMNGTFAERACWSGPGGRLYQSNTSYNPQRIHVRIRTKTTTPPGNYTLTFHTEATTTPGAITINIPITVVATPSVPTKSPVISPPAIPGLATWEDSMLAGADKWCKHMTNCSPGGLNCAFGTESQVWYYDGARTYFQIGDYTGDHATWDSCAYYQADQYAAYVNVTTVSGVRIFPQGLAIAYQRTGTTTYKNAVTRLATTSSFALATSIADAQARENAYMVQSYIWDHKLSGTYNALLDETVSKMLGWVDLWYIDEYNYNFHQMFWDGLWAQALIDYYEWTKARGIHHRLDATGAWVNVAGPDPRIPIAIRTMLDWFWAHWSEPGHTNMMRYNALDTQTQVPPPYCDSLSLNCCDVDCGLHKNDIIQLALPAFGWYYNLTGNDTYRVRGDEMWKYAPRAFRADVDAGTDVYTTLVAHGLSADDYIQTSAAVYGSGELDSDLQVENVLSPTTFTTKTLAGAHVNITSSRRLLVSPYVNDPNDDGSPQMSYLGKIFSQNARWSFDYVRWRQASDAGRRIGAGMLSGTGTIGR